MGSENIKPCPFCGRRADLRRTSLVASWDIVGGWFVACEGAPGDPREHCGVGPARQSPAAAIAVWNAASEAWGLVVDLDGTNAMGNDVFVVWEEFKARARVLLSEAPNAS